jgi:membrane protease YdiL (CAAX protease family)
LLFGFVFLVLVQRVLRGGARGMPQGAWRLAVLYVLMNGGLLALAWLFLRALDRRGFRALGLWFYAGWGRESLVGIGIGAGLVTTVVLGMALTQVVSYEGMNPAAGVWTGTLVSAGVLFLAAAFEEIVFRGYAFQRLVDSFGKLGAILILSALFGLGHLGNPSANPLSTANTVLAGVLLSVAYLKTRALWMPTALHWTWNLMVGPIYSLPVSGAHIGPGLFVAEIGGPEWLSGGAYGPEGSVVLTVVCAAAIIWLARTEAVAPSLAMQETLKSPPPASV